MRVLGRETRGQNESEMGGRMVEEDFSSAVSAPSAGPPAGGVEQEHL